MRDGCGESRRVGRKGGLPVSGSFFELDVYEARSAAQAVSYDDAASDGLTGGSAKFAGVPGTVLLRTLGTRAVGCSAAVRQVPQAGERKCQCNGAVSERGGGGGWSA